MAKVVKLVNDVGPELFEAPAPPHFSCLVHVINMTKSAKNCQEVTITRAYISRVLLHLCDGYDHDLLCTLSSCGCINFEGTKKMLSKSAPPPYIRSLSTERRYCNAMCSTPKHTVARSLRTVRLQHAQPSPSQTLRVHDMPTCPYG